MKKSLVISIIIFFLVAGAALYLVLNKGHIGEYSLVSLETDPEEVIPVVLLELEKAYLSSQDEEDVCKVIVKVDGVEQTEGVVLESSDENIAKINENNEIVPVEDGKVTIKAIYGKAEATADIKVITPIKSMSFTSTNSTIRVNKDLQLKLKVTPSDAYMDTLTYTSSDESIATVSPDGIVTGIAPGKVTITLFDSYTETEKTVNLTIRK